MVITAASQHSKRSKPTIAAIKVMAKIIPAEVLEIIIFYLYAYRDLQAILSICNRTLFSYYISRLEDCSIAIPGDLGRRLFLAPSLFSEICSKNYIPLEIFSEDIFVRTPGTSKLSISGEYLPIPSPWRIISAAQDNYFWFRHIASLEITHVKLDVPKWAKCLRSNVEVVVLSHISTTENHLLSFLSLFPKLKQLSLLYSQIVSSVATSMNGGGSKISILRIVKNAFSHDGHFDKTPLFGWLITRVNWHEEPSILELNGVKMSLASFLTLTGFSNKTISIAIANKLESISLDNCMLHSKGPVSPPLANLIKRLPVLKRLSFRSFELDMVHMRRILFNLVELDLAFNSSLTEESLHDILLLSKCSLKCLSLEGIQSISTRSLCKLVQMLKLEQLNVSHMAINLSQLLDAMMMAKLSTSLRVLIAKNCSGLCSFSFLQLVKSVNYHSPMQIMDLSEGTCSNIRMETLTEAKTYLSHFACKLSC